MFKRILYISTLSVFLLLSGCSALKLSRQAPTGTSTLPSDFFKNTNRLAVQDFSFAEGVETNAFSPTDSAFLRSVIESKIVELSSLKVITRENKKILEKEMAYKAGAAGKEVTDQKEETMKTNLGVDAFVYGVIYEYEVDPTTKKYSMTTAVKIVSTSNGRLWQSKIINVSGEKSKHQLFDKLATILAKNLVQPVKGPTEIKRTIRRNEKMKGEPKKINEQIN